MRRGVARHIWDGARMFSALFCALRIPYSVPRDLSVLVVSQPSDLFAECEPESVGS
jgi:hypothetical protein